MPRKPSEAEALADRLHSSAIHLLRRVRKHDSASGEGPARLSALSVLVFGGGPRSLGELADAEQVKPPTMSRIVAGLKRSRLVEIVPDPADARRKQIRATARGEAVIAAARRERILHLAAQLNRLSLAERRKLQSAAEVLDRLLQSWR
jgi:DNA-binding MarR family transcriptional regulator